MLKIEIKSADVMTKSGTSARTGKPYTIREQLGYWHAKGKAYPIEVKITLDDSAQPFAPGVYTLGEESFMVGRFGDLQIGRLHLVNPAQARSAA